MSEAQAQRSATAFDKESILAFLLITFGITWGAEGIMLARGVSFLNAPPIMTQYIVALLMWAPAIGAAITRRFILHESLRVPEARLRPGPWKPYLAVMLAMPLLFALVYGVTVLAGFGTADLSLNTFIAQLEKATSQALPQHPPSGIIIMALFSASVLVTPFFNSIFAFGEEYGWRGFLLPKLLPLGRTRAHLIGGVIWGLWHAPLVLMGFNYPGFPWIGVVMMCALTTLLGIFESEWTLKYNSVLLASFIHGAFNAQAYGIWRVIVPGAQPLLGGLGGLVGLAGVAMLAAWGLRDRVKLKLENQMEGDTRNAIH
jgi:uncharacterized protein